jgi:DNA-binding IclR family transcriptional regulator
VAVSTLQTLDRGLSVLELVSQRPAGVSVAELAAALDVHRAICYRIVATLEAHALVSRAEDGRIRLGAGTAVLAARFEPQLRHTAQPVLHALARETRATAYVSVAQGEDCIVVLVAEPESSLIRVGYRVGSRHRLTVGAAGIAILALRPRRHGEPDAVDAARRDGYCVTAGQLERGAVGVASGIEVPSGMGGGTGIEACVGVVALDGLDVAAAATAVVRAAREISALVSA